MQQPLDEYLARISRVRALNAGAPETSLYEALQEVLNLVGSRLKPKVFCVSQLQDTGAGRPDFGLFVATQLRRGSLDEPAPPEPPQRGVIEAKPIKDNIEEIARSPQVARYWQTYGLVLVTNYWQFILVGRDQFGRCVNLEHFELAERADDFLELVVAEKRAAPALKLRFAEFLQRILLHNATIISPRDVAWFLASYARDALARIETAGSVRGLETVKETLEEALGMKFEGERGGHFFHSTLVQTLFYGVFSAWVLWCKTARTPEERKGFDAKGAAWHLRLPVLRALFEQINTPGRLGPLRLDEVVDWAALTLRRTDDKAFFSRFQEDHAVQYFYEPFLEAFDPKLRDELGVWYTPPEVVEYMVERVDAVLRAELGLADGLADPNVYVLDPCAGTGSYLVAVLKRIERTLRDKGDDALVAADIKRAALERVFGFELLPAPFVVAHLQLSLFLESLGVKLSARTPTSHTSVKDERPAVYLTNALVGWQEPKPRTHYLPLPELQDEMDAAGHVKRDVPILVILGNPPYNVFAGVGIEEERALADAYRTTKRVRKPEGHGLNDLYVRFFRMAEQRIVEKTGRGVVCFISNYSWLDGLSHTGMRERFLEVFDRVWIDCLNGDKYKTGKLTPGGDPDPSIFSTERNREGIQVGTAISLLVRDGGSNPDGARVRFRHLWGVKKREALTETKTNDGVKLYTELTPSLELGLPFVPMTTRAGYIAWPKLTELLPVSFPGVKTSRDDALVSIDRDALVSRMDRYFDSNVNDERIADSSPSLMRNTGRFMARETRRTLTKRGMLRTNIVPYCYRPFDNRWVYWEPEGKLLDEKRTDYFPHVFDGNHWIEARERQPKEAFDRGYYTRVLGDNFGNGLSHFVPLYLRDDGGAGRLFRGAPTTRPNLSEAARAYLAKLNADPEDLFFHALAILHAPEYRKENAGALRQDWPRAPLPAERSALEASAALGRKLAVLLDPEAEVPGVTAGTIRPELRALGLVSRQGGGALGDDDLGVTARWGFAGQNGVTMAGPGNAPARAYSEDERKALAAAGADAFKLLGEQARDVFLNDRAYWRCCPERVWTYTLGGYQVLKKWLSYREQTLLGRPLRPEEARYVANVIRRIAAILLLGPELDANYRRTTAKTEPLAATLAATPTSAKPRKASRRKS